VTEQSHFVKDKINPAAFSGLPGKKIRNYEQ